EARDRGPADPVTGAVAGIRLAVSGRTSESCRGTCRVPAAAWTELKTALGRVKTARLQTRVTAKASALRGICIATKWALAYQNAKVGVLQPNRDKVCQRIRSRRIL